MEQKDPRLIARSETDRRTRFMRPESARPAQDDVRERGPQIDPDELLSVRDEELASESRWRVRLDNAGLWWATIGGYTTYQTSAKKWESRWDAYNQLVGERTFDHTWDIEMVPRPTPLVIAAARNARFSELAQAWTTRLPDAPGRHPEPEDGLVHALVGENVPGWALCGTQVGYWTGDDWPPSAMKRCERCNSIASTLPN